MSVPSFLLTLRCGCYPAYECTFPSYPHSGVVATMHMSVPSFVSTLRCGCYSARECTFLHIHIQVWLLPSLWVYCLSSPHSGVAGTLFMGVLSFLRCGCYPANECTFVLIHTQVWLLPCLWVYLLFYLHSGVTVTLPMSVPTFLSTLRCGCYPAYDCTFLRIHTQVWLLACLWV